MHNVAPHAGAWIETQYSIPNKALLRSHPMRVRGLKHLRLTITATNYVAPHAGAWIETSPYYY